jgi:hypothetical protein
MKQLLLGLLLPVMALAGDLPDPVLTPGVTRGITLKQVCTTKWGKDARAVTSAMKTKVYKSYGMVPHQGACAISTRGCEIDHLVSRELGGADDIKNLWPQPYGGEWNAIMKDRLENRLHKLICATDPVLTLAEAQTAIKIDWIAAFKKYVSQ